MIQISGLSATISYNKNRLVASTEITSAVEISNVSNEDKFVTVFNVLYDSSENIVEFSSMSDCVRANNTRTFEYWLETNSNNMLLFYLPSQGYIESKCKGENNGKECIFSLEIDPGDFEHFLIMEVLPTGNSGGMRNSFRVTSN